MKQKLLCSFLILINLVSFGQESKDSLWGIWNNEKIADTSRLAALDQIAHLYIKSNPDSALIFYQYYFDYAENKKLEKSMALALLKKGDLLRAQSDYSKALDFYQQSLSINRAIDNKLGILTDLLRIGNSHLMKNEQAQALDYLEECLILSTEMDIKEFIARSSTNIGIVYYYQGDYSKSLSFYNQSFTIKEELGDKKGVALTLTNIGEIFHKLGYYTRALEYYNRALRIQKEIEIEKDVLALLNANIGEIYELIGNHSKAMDYYQTALSLYEDELSKYQIIGMKQLIAGLSRQQADFEKAIVDYEQSLYSAQELENEFYQMVALMGLGKVMEDQGDFEKANLFNRRALTIAESSGYMPEATSLLIDIGYNSYKLGETDLAIRDCKKGLVMAEEIHRKESQKSACECLYDAYKSLGTNAKALDYLERMNVLEDSMKTEETARSIQQMEFHKQITADSLAKVEKDRVIKQAHEEEVRTKEKQRDIFIGSGLLVLLLAGGLWSRLSYVRKSKASLQTEKDRSDSLLLNILPEEIAIELKTKGKAEAREFEMVSILFTDFKGFTEASAELSAQNLVAEINTCFEAFDGILDKYGIEKIKTIGDAYMAAGGLPVPSEDSVKNTVLAALEMQAFISKRKVEMVTLGKHSFEMRAGIHTGPVVAGIVGVKKFQYDIWGDTVNTASRMESNGQIGKVNISKYTYELIRDNPQFTFESRGKIQAKGKGEIEMYLVERTEI